jgi:hypothetical protein
MDEIVQYFRDWRHTFQKEVQPCIFDYHNFVRLLIVYFLSLNLFESLIQFFALGAPIFQDGLALNSKCIFAIATTKFPR